MLGTVQGAALRSDRARTRGLRALTVAARRSSGGQLRDGRRMLFPSGTQGALIERSHGLASARVCSIGFRKRALHSLVEVLPSDMDEFVRASAVDTRSDSSSDEDSELGELRV